MSSLRIDTSIRVAKIEAWLYRAAVSQPMVTSFARLDKRSVLLVRITDADGCFGWGEAYCNFPPNGGEHRLALLAALLAPPLLRRTLESPEAVFDELTAGTAVLARQTGEPGPIAQCIAAIDIGLWDLLARRARLPLAALLSPAPVARVSAYATGLSPERLEEVLRREKEKGHRAFKLKLGFGEETDLSSMRLARDTVGPLPVAVDANQAWDLQQAMRMAQRLADFEPLWLEEPLAADAPEIEWRRLRQATSIPLAAGENLYTAQALHDLIDAGHVQYVQPDPVKWGGITGVRRIARAASAAGRVFCPHFIGSGLGAAACRHLVAAVGSARSLVEIDPNENPLREPLALPAAELREGGYAITDAPGLGVEPDLAAAAPFLVRHVQVN